MIVKPSNTDRMPTPLRPHVAASTNQAAFHVLQLDEMIRGEITKEQFSEATMNYSSTLYVAGIELGNLSQSSDLPLPEKMKRIADIHAAILRGA